MVLTHCALSGTTRAQALWLRSTSVVTSYALPDAPTGTAPLCSYAAVYPRVGQSEAASYISPTAITCTMPDFGQSPAEVQYFTVFTSLNGRDLGGTGPGYRYY
eukprot:1260607-Rhodomonas_salina.2